MSGLLANSGAEGALSPAQAIAPAATPAAQAASQNAERAEASRRAVDQPGDSFESGSQITEVETRITVDDDTHEPVVRVLDARTDEVIREIPPEKIRKMAEFLSQWVGLRMDDRA